MKRFVFLVSLLLMALSGFGQTIGNTTGTATGGFTLMGGQILTLKAQVVGCNNDTPTYQGTPVSITPNQTPAAPFTANGSQVVSFTLPGNDQVICGGQNYSLYAFTWQINGHPAGPTKTYRLTDGSSFNLNTATAVGFVPPVLNNTIGAQCHAGFTLNGFNADYTPVCIPNQQTPTLATGAIGGSSSVTSGNIGGTFPNYVLNLNVQLPNFVINSVTSGGSPAVVINGSSAYPNYLLDFTLQQGPAPVFGSPSVSTLASGSSATIGQSGAGTGGSPLQLAFGIPRGVDGFGSAANWNSLYKLLPGIQTNFFNGAAVNQTGFINPANGTITAGSPFTTTGFIPCNGALTTSLGMIGNGSTSGQAFYDQNFTFLSGSTAVVAAGGTITCPGNAVYMRGTFGTQNASTLSRVMIVQGSTLPSVFVPFNWDATPNTLNTTQQRWSAALPTNYNYFDQTQVTSNQAPSSANGTLSAISGFSTSTFIPVYQGEQFVLAQATGASNASFAVVAFYDVNKTFISAIPLPDTVGTVYTAPEAGYARIMSANNKLSTQMFTQGTTVPGSYVVFGGQVNLAVFRTGAQTYADTVSNKTQTSSTAYNYFDSSRGSLGHLIGSGTGAETTGNGNNFSESDYIPVQAGDQLMATPESTASNPSFCAAAWYDANKTWLSCTALPYTANEVFTAPANGYVRFLMDQTAGRVTVNGITSLTGISGTGGGDGVSRGMVTKTTTAPTQFAAFGGSFDPPLGRSTYAKRLGILGDSITAIYAANWLPTILQRTGLTLVWQDARHGRNWSQAFECYGAATPTGTISTYNSANTNCNLDSSNVGSTNGNTLAQNIANVDLLMIVLGTNDGGFAVGAPGDAPSANTDYGNMQWVVSNLQQANPTMRIVIVSPYFNFISSATQARNVTNAEIGIGQNQGIPVLDMLANSGINSFNNCITPSATCWITFDGTHPNPTGGAKLIGPAISQFLGLWQ